MKLRGFTLVEMILSIAMMGMMAALLGPWLVTSIKSYDLITSRQTMLAQVRSGFDRMTREIRLIPGQSQVTATTASSFQFQYPAGTSITYSLSGTNLMRNSDVLIPNVSALSFTYYDQSGASTVTASSVRSVSFQITATPTDPTIP